MTQLVRFLPRFPSGSDLVPVSFVHGSSPGPVHYIHPAQTRTGREGTPSYSLRKRTKPLEPYPIPGPGAYWPERTPVLDYKRAPKYTFGVKGTDKSVNRVPSPDTYNIKTTIGRDSNLGRKGPSYSMTGRGFSGSFAEDRAKTPGPAAYHCDRSDLFLKRSLSYTMLARNFGIEVKTQCPPPGSYSPERCASPYRRTPEPSFGIKHSDFVAPVQDAC